MKKQRLDWPKQYRNWAADDWSKVLLDFLINWRLNEIFADYSIPEMSKQPNKEATSIIVHINYSTHQL